MKAGKWPQAPKDYSAETSARTMQVCLLFYKYNFTIVVSKYEYSEVKP